MFGLGGAHGRSECSEKKIKLESVDLDVKLKLNMKLQGHSAPKGSCRRSSNKEDGGSSLDDSCGYSKPTSAESVDVVFSS